MLTCSQEQKLELRVYLFRKMFLLIACIGIDLAELPSDIAIVRNMTYSFDLAQRWVRRTHHRGKRRAAKAAIMPGVQDPIVNSNYQAFQLIIAGKLSLNQSRLV